MKLLLTGASGQLGHYLLQELRGSAIEFCAWSRNREDEVFDKSLTPVDLATDPSVVEAAYHRASPDVILHAAAVTTTAAAYKHPERTHRINTHATKQLLEQGLLGLTNSPHTGTVHLGGPERMNRYDMGMRIAHAVGANTNHLVATRQADLEFPEPRPHDVSLDSSRWRSLCPHSPWPTLESAVSQFLQQSNQ